MKRSRCSYCQGVIVLFNTVPAKPDEVWREGDRCEWCNRRLQCAIDVHYEIDGEINNEVVAWNHYCHLCFWHPKWYEAWRWLRHEIHYYVFIKPLTWKWRYNCWRGIHFPVGLVSRSGETPSSHRCLHCDKALNEEEVRIGREHDL